MAGKVASGSVDREIANGASREAPFVYRALRRLVRLSAFHPWFVVGMASLLTVAAALLIPRVRIDLDGRMLIPAGHSALQASDAAARRFHRRDVMVLAVRSSGSVFRAETLARVARLTRRITALAAIDPDSVLSLATFPQPVELAAGLTVQRLVRDGGPLSPREVERVRRAVDDLGLRDGLLVGSDGRTALVVAEVLPGADRQALLARLRAIAREESGGRDRVLATGTALAQATLGDAVALDLLCLIPAVLAVIAILLAFAFRRPGPPLISLAEIGVSLIWTAGILGMLRQSVFVTTLVLPVVLIAVGVSDDIHALRHYFAQDRVGDARERIASSLAEIAPAVLLTALSTIVGLASLALTSLQPLRVFGLFGALAIAFSTLMTFTLVPALLALTETRVRSERGIPPLPRMDGPALRAIAAHPLALACVVAFGVAAVITIAFRLRVDDSWYNNLPARSEVARADRLLNRAMAGTMTLDFAVDTGRADGLLDPAVLARLGRFEDALAAAPRVGAVTSVADDVCRLQAALRGAPYQEIRDGVRRGEIVLTEADVAQSMLLLSSIRRPALNRRADDAFRTARVTVFIRDASYPVIVDLVERADAASSFFSRVVPFGDAWVSYETVRILVSGQMLGIPAAVLTDFVLLALVFRSLRRAVAAVAPVVVSSLFVFALFAATGTPIGIANSMFTGIALGVGTDFSIHLIATFARSGIDPGAIAETGSSILVSAGSMALGFSVLLLSSVGPTVQLGAAISITVLVCALNTLVLVPRLAGRRPGARQADRRPSWRRLAGAEALPTAPPSPPRSGRG